MTLNIKHSKVYGTEDWFDGEPNVYSITETEADCLPEVSLVRNHASFRAGGWVPTDQAPVADFSVRDNVVVKKIAEYSGDPSPYGRGYRFVTSDEYIYWVLGDLTTITRYNIQTEATTVADVGKAMLHISLLDEHQVLYLVYEADEFRLYLYNFETTDNDLLTAYPDEGADYYAGSSYGIYTYVTNGIARTLMIMDGSKWVVEGEDWIYTGYCHIRVYDHSSSSYVDHSVMVPSRAALPSELSLGQTWFFYCEAALIDNKLIWPAVMYDKVDTNYEMPVLMYDFSADTFTRYTVLMSETWGSDGPYNLGVDIDSNKVYFNAYYRQDGIDLSLMEWDVATNTGQWVWDHAADYPIPVSGNRPLVFMYEDAAYAVYYADALVTPLFAPDYQYLSYNVDEGSDIFWVLDKAGQRIFGYSIPGGSTTIISDTGIQTDYQTYAMAVYGNKLIIGCNKVFSPKRQAIFLVINEEAE
jgi:hypothetical protein